MHRNIYFYGIVIYHFRFCISVALRILVSVNIFEPQMISIAAMLLIGHVAIAQDANCDYYQAVQTQTTYRIYSPNYPYSYPPSKSCRWIGTCPQNTQCKLDCVLEMPNSPGCSVDKLLISRSGDPQLIGAETYCGYQTLENVYSVNQKISVGLLTNNNQGRFYCNLTAQAALAPPPAGCVCGVRKQNRIVGGTQASDHEFPSVVAIIERSIDRILCGAVIISNRTLMTAAHCVYGLTPAEVVLAMGTNDVESETSGRRYNAASFTIHRQFNENTFDYDIALVNVAGIITYNDNISPVCLPFKFLYSNLTGVNVTLPGWGTLYPGGPIARYLRKVDVGVISQQQCQSTEPYITDRQICTKTPGKDACQNDSGGPALLMDPQSGRLFSVGIISNGNNCAARPGVNTRVTALLQWILDNNRSNYCVVR